MAERPNIKAGHFVKYGIRDAIVNKVHETPYRPEAEVELIYVDDRDRAINIEAYWNGERWTSDDPMPGYADNYDRLRERVAELRYFLYVKSRPDLWKLQHDQFVIWY